MVALGLSRWSAAQQLPRFKGRFAGYGATVDHIQISRVAEGNGSIPGLLECFHKV